jgi:hypothetical protein
MKTKQIKGMEIDKFYKNGYSPETPDHIPKLHALMILNGRRNAGKTTAITNYLHILKNEKLIDRIIVITPTYESNKANWTSLGIDREDIIQPTKDAVQKVLEIIKQESQDWDTHLENKKRFKQMVDSDTPIHKLPPIFLQALINSGGLDPIWKYEKEVPPRLFLVLDDCLGWDIYKPSAGLTKFVQSHRHHHKIGVSVALLVQTYCTKEAGVARPIRENCTLLCLWQVKDKNQLARIHDEIGNDVSLEKFDEMLKYATDKPFGFMMIDFSSKKPEYAFRSGFNEYLLT